jgi:hypothetical protein
MKPVAIAAAALVAFATVIWLGVHQPWDWSYKLQAITVAMVLMAAMAYTLLVLSRPGKDLRALLWMLVVLFSIATAYTFAFAVGAIYWWWLTHPAMSYEGWYTLVILALAIALAPLTIRLAPMAMRLISLRRTSAMTPALLVAAALVVFFSVTVLWLGGSWPLHMLLYPDWSINLRTLNSSVSSVLLAATVCALFASKPGRNLLPLRWALVVIISTTAAYALVISVWVFDPAYMFVHWSVFHPRDWYALVVPAVAMALAPLVATRLIAGHPAAV